jgi:hypothetical protein
MASPTLEAIQGSDSNWQQTLISPDGITPYGLYPGSATFLCTLWPGGNLPAITPGLTAAWIDPTQGTYSLSLPLASSSLLTVGTYRYLVEIINAGVQTSVKVGSIKVIGRAGTGSAIPVYGTMADMKKILPSIEKLMDTDSDSAGFVTECGLAREWMDSSILRHYDFGSMATAIYPCVGWGSTAYMTGATSKYLSDLLVANHLIVTPSVVKCVSLYALSLVCQAQILGSGNTDYLMLGDSFLRRAQDAMICLTAEIDVNGDGIAEITVELGTTRPLRG